MFIIEQGIIVEAVNFLTVFCNCTNHGKSCLASKSAADHLGIRLKVFEVSKDYFEIVKNPKHGYGSNMNPCLDCRIFMFSKARAYMKDTGASFVITGEVLGERPMSQRRDAMRIIERESGLQDLIVRPLSAKLLEPSIPEKEGIINRERLLDISGRSRKPQIQLAKEFGINDYPCPAGGCLLTDPAFAARMRDLIKFKPEFTVNDVRLLKVGRYFRLSDEARLVVGRDEDENKSLSAITQEEDMTFYAVKRKGPLGIGRGRLGEKDIWTAASILARYSDGGKDEPVEIAYRGTSPAITGVMKVAAQRDEGLSLLRI